MSVLQHIACDHCDLLIAAPIIEVGQCALCPRCKHKISRLRPNAFMSLFAYAVTGLVLLVLANLFGLMQFKLAGNVAQITLWQSASELYFDVYKILSILVFLFTIVFPALVLLMIIMFLITIKTGIGKFYMTSLLRLIFTLIPWSMAEVFIVGIIVSLVKLVTIAQMHLGWSFWAYTAFALCYLKVLSLVDRYQFWHWIEGWQHD